MDSGTLPLAGQTPERSDPADRLPATARLAEIVQTILTGLILALIFRAFVVEAFIIPTGSMAESLLGAHATRVCPACGWEFSFAPLRSASPSANGFVVPPEVTCPNCQLRLEATPAGTVPKAGDRVLVHKWPYALGRWLGPGRWDVIVFRDPADPQQHYIKRVVGLPGETVEIVDGDLFINGQIARKPPSVQEALWFIVYDQSHVEGAGDEAGRRTRWIAIDPPSEGYQGWSGLDTRVIRYDGLDSTWRTLAFNWDAGPEYLLDFYAYNRRSSGTQVGDVRLCAELVLGAGAGAFRLELTRPPWRFTALLHRDGRVRLELESLDDDREPTVLEAGSREPLPLGRPIAIEFGHVDYRVYVKIDGRDLLSTTDAQYAPQLEALRSGPGGRRVAIRLAACNFRLELRRLRLDRDVHYTCRPGTTQRAAAGQPFALQAGEYFVLGDNSPDSHDSREWTETEVGPHLPADYRAGTVRAEQIVGQAAFVYLPGLLPLDRAGRWLVPDLGRVRFVR